MAIINQSSVQFDSFATANGDFHAWTLGVPDNWSIDSGSVVEDLSTSFVGQRSIKVIASPTGVVSQLISTPTAYQNKTLRFVAWVKCSTAATARIALTDDSGTVYSDWHTGSGVWEELVVEKAVTTPTFIQVELLVTGSSGEANFDAADISLWHFDEGDYVFDGDSYLDVVIEFETTVNPPQGLYIAMENPEVDIEFFFEELVTYIKFIDLMPLVPQKFHAKEPGPIPSTGFILEDLIYQLGRDTGTWMTKADELKTLVDPYSVDEDYIKFLAQLIGLELVVDDNSTLPDLRDQVSQAIDWYKIKGTYQSLFIVAYLSGFTTRIYDLYTNDYATFVKVEDWFVAMYPGENPPGLDSSYYKSPHFFFEVVLDRRYGIPGYYSLWKDAQLESITKSVEKVRPVNTVPHYGVVVEPITTEDEACYLTDTGIITRVTNYWVQANLHFDMTSSLDWYFDGGKTFDATRDGFLAAVTNWKLGIGNIGHSPCESGFALEDVVLTGSGVTYELFADRVELEFIVDQSVAVTGLSELALCLTTGEEVLHSTFPTIDKTFGVELRIRITVYFIS